MIDPDNDKEGERLTLQIWAAEKLRRIGVEPTAENMKRVLDEKPKAEAKPMEFDENEFKRDVQSVIAVTVEGIKANGREATDREIMFILACSVVKLSREVYQIRKNMN